MIVFEGVVSDDVKKRALIRKGKRSRNVSIVGSVVSGLLLFVILVISFLNSDTGYKEVFFGPLSGIVWIVLLAFLAFFGYTIFKRVKPFSSLDLTKVWNYKITISENEIHYIPQEKFGENIIPRNAIKNVFDDGDSYVICYGEKGNEFVCEKKLLKEGSLEEFEGIFFEGKDIEFEGKIENLTTSTSENVELNVFDEQGSNAKKEEWLSAYQNASKEKNKKKKLKKFKNDANYVEHKFKFSIIGIICSVACVLLTFPFFKYGLTTIFSLISGVTTWFFQSGFVCELFTFLFAIFAIGVVSIFGILFCVVLTPALAIISLAFPIVQLVKSRHWFNWLALVIGILAIVGCVFVMIFVLEVI